MGMGEPPSSSSAQLHFSLLIAFNACRLGGSNRVNQSPSIDWTLCSSKHVDQLTSDVIAPSPWTIFGCQNGLWKFNCVLCMTNLKLLPLIVFILVQVFGFLRN